MSPQQTSWWQMRPAVRCLAFTLLVPALWMATVSGLEATGHADIALGVGWLTIPLVMIVLPAGLLLSLVLAVTSRRNR